MIDSGKPVHAKFVFVLTADYYRRSVSHTLCQCQVVRATGTWRTLLHEAYITNREETDPYGFRVKTSSDKQQENFIFFFPFLLLVCQSNPHNSLCTNHLCPLGHEHMFSASHKYVVYSENYTI